MDLRDIGATLPPGFKFCPSDEELVYHYLWKKIANEENHLKGTALLEIDLHSCEPWELPGKPEMEEERLWRPEMEWPEWDGCFRDRKYTTGYRVNRATKSGYWKATGKDRNVVDSRIGGSSVMGMRKSLVFYKNRAPHGIKTGWVMHEFRIDNPHLPPKEDWVLCRVFYKAKSEENSTQQNGFDTTGGGGDDVATSSHYFASLSPPPTHQHQATSFSQSSPHHNQNHNPSNINLSLQSQPNPSPLNVSRVINEAPIHEMFINSRCEEDQYGYLFGVNFEDSHSFYEYCREHEI
ncbi:hypothetical protein LguiB_031532 [Lonicera macranthoides]